MADPRGVRHLFDAAHLALVIEAVTAGSFRASLWVDDPAAPRTALLWDGSHGIYLVGAVDRPEEWRELLAREVLPAGQGMFKADVPDAVAAMVLPGRRLDRRARRIYRADPEAVGVAHSSPPRNGSSPRDASSPGNAISPRDATLLGDPAGPDRSGTRPGGAAASAAGLGEGWPDGSEASHGLRISEINACFDELVGLANAAEVLAEIEYMWPSVDAFRRDGFGFVAHDESTIATWCTAEYASPGRCGIGIETVAAFRRRGIATATARAFLAHSASLGLTAHWDAWAANLPSIAVAERIGLHLVETYHVHVGDFEDGQR